MSTKQGGEIEIPEVAIKELKDILFPILKEEIVLIGRGRGTIMGYGGAAEKAAIAALRHLSPSIDRYPDLPWLKDLIEMAEDGDKLNRSNGVHQEFLEENRDVLRKAKSFLKDMSDIRQPFESPAIPPTK
jgi:hypothetical protein